MRINPRNAFVQPIGRLDTVGQIGFTSHGVYLAGGKALQRLRNEDWGVGVRTAIDH